MFFCSFLFPNFSAVRSIERQIVYGFPRTQLFGFGSAQESLSSSSTFSWPGGIVEADQQRCQFSSITFQINLISQLYTSEMGEPTAVEHRHLSTTHPGCSARHTLGEPCGACVCLFFGDSKWKKNLFFRDSFGKGKEPYRGPVPVVIQVVGGVAKEESSGYPQAWYLPKCNDIPDGFTKVSPSLLQHFIWPQIPSFVNFSVSFLNFLCNGHAFQASFSQVNQRLRAAGAQRQGRKFFWFNRWNPAGWGEVVWTSPRFRPKHKLN